MSSTHSLSWYMYYVFDLTRLEKTLMFSVCLSYDQVWENTEVSWMSFIWLGLRKHWCFLFYDLSNLLDNDVVLLIIYDCFNYEFVSSLLSRDYDVYNTYVVWLISTDITLLVSYHAVWDSVVNITVMSYSVQTSTFILGYQHVEVIMNII